MKQPHLLRTALALAVVALVAACGGDESPRSAGQAFADALSPNIARSDRLRALAAGTGGGTTAGAASVAITDAQLFQGAEAIFPELFPSPQTAIAINNLRYDNKVFQVRMYSNGNYLGVGNDGNVYGLGPYTNGQLVNFDAKQSYSDLVCSRINCGTTGGGGGSTGALNGCTEGASVALRTGTRYTAVYTNSVLVAPTSTGEYQLEGEVEGSTTFEGQQAVKLRNKIKGSQFGATVDSNVLAYMQAADNDLIRTLASEVSMTFEGFPATSRMVYNPPSLNSEYTLAVGGTLTKTESFTSTTSIPSLPIPIPPTAGTTKTTYTYEARESITVLDRNWETCRYKSVVEGTPGATFHWAIVGKGFTARTESRNAAGTVEYRSELKSATVNGASL